jgi:hypothetical protein
MNVAEQLLAIPADDFVTSESFQRAADYRTKRALPIEPGALVYARNWQLWFREEASRMPRHRLLANFYDLTVNAARFNLPGNVERWFAVNVTGTHPKITGIPGGVKIGWLPDAAPYRDPSTRRDILLYVNFAVHNNGRRRAMSWAQEAGWPHIGTYDKNKTVDYLATLAQARFTLSPAGHGLDCYRTWEALLMGSIPVVESSGMDSLYASLPVLIVNDWAELSPAFLEREYERLAARTYSLNILRASYWREALRA